MKARVKAAVKAAGTVLNSPNRRQGITANLCVCGHTKAEHFNNALGCIFKASSTKNKSYDPS